MNTFLSDGVFSRLLYQNYRERNNQKSKDYLNVGNLTLFEIYTDKFNY